MNTRPPPPTQAELDAANARRQLLPKAIAIGAAAAILGFAFQKQLNMTTLWILILGVVAGVATYITESVGISHETPSPIDSGATNIPQEILQWHKSQARKGAMLGTAFRWIMTTVTSFGVWYIGWNFLEQTLYAPFGHPGFTMSLLNLIWGLTAGYMGYNMFDWTVIKINRMASIFFMGIPISHNVKPGLVAYGFWKQFITLKVVTTEVLLFDIGDSKSKGSPFVRETQAGEVTITASVKYQIFSSKKYLAYDSNPPEDKASAVVEAAITKYLNSLLYVYLTRPLRDANGNIVLDGNGDQIPAFLRARDMRSSLQDIARDLMEGNYLPVGEGAVVKLADMGVELQDFLLKQINSNDDRVNRAMLDLELQRLQDEAEMLDTENTVKKVTFLYNTINRIGQHDEIPNDRKYTIEECMKAVERREKVRQTIEFTGNGGARPFVNV